MKAFLQFAFAFLYVRNWHTGRQELSRRRVMMFGGSLFLVVIALVLIGVLQAPYEVENEAAAFLGWW